MVNVYPLWEVLVKLMAKFPSRKCLNFRYCSWSIYIKLPIKKIFDLLVVLQEALMLHSNGNEERKKNNKKQLDFSCLKHCSH